MYILILFFEIMVNNMASDCHLCTQLLLTYSRHSFFNMICVLNSIVVITIAHKNFSFSICMVLHVVTFACHSAPDCTSFVYWFHHVLVLVLFSKQQIQKSANSIAARDARLQHARASIHQLQFTVSS